MEIPDAQLTIISLLAKNEREVESLYRTYAELFPEEKDFWNELAEDEGEHAGVIESLHLHTKAEDWVFFNEKRFPPEAIKAVTEYVSTLRQAAKLNPPPLTKALSLAAELENSLLEAKYFEVYEGDSARFKEILKKIHGDTDDHGQKIKELIIKYKIK